MVEIKRHIEKIIDANTLVRELSQFEDIKVVPSNDGLATRFIGPTGNEVVIRPSKSSGIAADFVGKSS